MPLATHASISLASRPPSTCSLGSSSYRSYAPRKPSPLAEGASTSPPSSVVASPTPSPPDSPKSLSFTDASTASSTPSMLCPQPTHPKPLPTRVQTVHRPATTSTTSYSPKSGPAPAPASPHAHRRIQSTSSPTLLCNPVSGTVEKNARQLSARQTPIPLRPARPSTSRTPEENWMTSESAPRFTRESLVLGAVVLPVRKDDAQRAKRQASLKSGTHIRHSSMPNTTVGTTSAVLRVSRSQSSDTIAEKESHKIPSVQVVDVDGTIQTVDELGIDLSSRDGAGKKKATSLGHVRKFSRDFAAKMKIRSGQVKPMVAVIQEKGPDSGLPIAIEKDQNGLDPRTSTTHLKRTKSIWGYILAI